MRRTIPSLLLLLVWVPAARTHAQPTFEYRLLGPDSLVGDPGELVPASFRAAIAAEGIVPGESGPQGWTLSVASEGLVFLGATTAGTAGAEASSAPGVGLRENGFERTELTAGAGNEGVISAVVLSYTQPITLPVDDGPQEVLRIDAEVLAPEGDDRCLPYSVAFRDGLSGIGQPVRNRVTYEAITFVPSLLGLSGEICQKSPFTFAIGGETVVPAPPGVDIVTMRPIATLATTLPGVQGWSFSLESIGPHCSVAGATVDGTVAADRSLDSVGLRDGGFESVEIASAAANGGRTGVVCGIVLSFTDPVELPPGEAQPVLALEFACDSSGLPEGETREHRLAWVGLDPADADSRLVGSGRPVKTSVTHDAVSRIPDGVDGVLVIGGIPPLAVFLRGDANADGRLNLADPIYTLNDLFRGGPPVPCFPAADVNADAMVDISDPIFSLTFQFLGGPPPPAPYPECGSVEGVDTARCPIGSTSCP